MKKLLVRVVLGLVLLLLLAAGAALLFLDPIVGTAIGKGATYATGVEAKVDGVDVGLRDGSFEMTGLDLANPPGFSSPHFLKLGKARAHCDTGTVLSDRIEMQELTLEGLDVALERNAQGSNWSKILDHIEKVSGPDEEQPEKPSEGSQRSLTIRRIELRGVHVALTLGDVPVVGGTHALDLPPIVIEDFRTDGSVIEIVSKLTRAIVTSVLEQSARSGGGIFPKDVLASLDQGLAGLRDELRGEARDRLQKELGEGAGKALDSLEGLLKKKP
jgi:hypothetical protein